MKNTYSCFVKIMMTSGIEYEIDNVSTVEIDSFYRALYYEQGERLYKIHGEMLNLNQIEATDLVKKEDDVYTIRVYTSLGREYEIENITKLETQDLYDAMLKIHTPLFHKLGNKMFNLREVEALRTEKKEYDEDYDIPDEYFDKGEN